MNQKLLTGKIYWVLDEFAYNGNIVFDNKKVYTAHTVTKLKNVVIQDNMIQFSTDEVNYDISDTFSYNVNLINERGNEYSGSFTEVLDPELKGNVSCELFDNKFAYFLYGRWLENDQYFTWWARIDK